MGSIGVVGFSFALRAVDQEPNPCNQRLGQEVMRIADKYQAESVVTQWEITRYVRVRRLHVDRSVELRKDRLYLDTQGVWDEAKIVFEAAGIREVVPVAQTFIHMILIKRMIRKDKFIVVKEQIKRIGFDPSPLNLQWWTKSASALVLYTILKVFEGVLGKFGIHRQRHQFN